MTRIESWMLPDGVEEILPDEAWQIENLRRRLLDMFQCWGYDLVIPPMMEFTDALLTGLGQDIDSLTFKVVDQVSGGSMAIRSDMTPQAARMDAHSLKRAGINRLCYTGHVLFTQPKSVLSSRNPLQIGVELFGDAGLDADIEVISLLIESINEAALPEISLDLGHVGIFRGLASACGLTSQQENELFALLQAKAMTDIANWISANIQNAEQAQWLLALPRLSGSVVILQRAAEVFANAPLPVTAALSELTYIAETLIARFPEINLYLDLSELRGYHYHTGVVFAAFAPGVGREIASGGRYDHIGEIFGRARPATGFTADLVYLKRLGHSSCPVPNGVFVGREVAIAATANELWLFIQRLRQQGERVVFASAAHPDHHQYQSCDRHLVLQDGQFHIKPLLYT